MARSGVADRIEAALGVRPTELRPLSGGSPRDFGAEVYTLTFADKTQAVAKVGRAGAKLDLEAWMLRTLGARSRVPAPGVLFTSDDLLVMDLLPSGGWIDAHVERDAAEIVAALHGVMAPKFGLERDTVIGGLHQPNPQSDKWLPFFRDQRLRFMADDAGRAGRLPAGTRTRIETLCGKLDRWIVEPAAPALIHGDLWSGNVLAVDGRVTGLIDPAIYYADPEIELAFTTLFGTFGEVFFRRYSELRPIREGFFEERRDLYNLYPLLVHVRLFGGGYVGQVEATLRRYGC
ncbi:MAG: fructosamine kinase [Alphaproteobacteria bacterium]|nr:fructosamine kinase [Alphaproteobacteria bacterium]